MAAERKIIWIDNMPAEDQKKCYSCTAKGSDYRGQIPFPLCQIARLQKALGENPKLGQIAKARIYVGEVPLDCPNGY